METYLAVLGEDILGYLSKTGIDNAHLAPGNSILVECGDDLISLIRPVLASKRDSKELDDERVLIEGHVVNVHTGNCLCGVERLGYLTIVGTGGIESSDVLGRSRDKVLLTNSLNDKLLAGGALGVGNLAVRIVGISGAYILHVVERVVVPDTSSTLSLVISKKTHINSGKCKVVNLLRLVSNNIRTNSLNGCINGTNVLGVHFF